MASLCLQNGRSTQPITIDASDSLPIDSSLFLFVHPAGDMGHVQNVVAEILEGLRDKWRVRLHNCRVSRQVARGRWESLVVEECVEGQRSTHARQIGAGAL